MDKKLDRNNIEDIMPLTDMQEAMLYHYISEPDSKKYQEQLSLTLTGDIKVEILQKSWDFVIETNEMLRVVYKWKNIKKTMQIVLKDHKVSIIQYDFSKQEDKNSMLNNLKIEDWEKKIDITKETLRIYLCKMDENACEMIISNHHILYDGWSNGIILNELLETYNLLYKGKMPIRINKSKYKEFIKLSKVQDKSVEEKFWREYLKGLEVTPLTSKNNKSSGKKIVKETEYILDNYLTSKVKSYVKKQKVSLASLLYSVWGILLQKYTLVEDIVFGTTVSGRNVNINKIENMVGLFINTIPIRVKSKDIINISELIRNVDNDLKQRGSYENTSYLDIKSYANVKTQTELFDSIVVIENYPLNQNLNNGGVVSVDAYSINEITEFNLVLSIITLFEEIELKFAYAENVFSYEHIKALGKQFEIIINEIVENPEMKISEIEMISEDEKRRILAEFNNTQTEYPKDKTIHELFEEQVEKTPNNVAVVYEEQKLTYSELNKKANSLAKVLRKKGVRADSIVAIMVEKSLDMIVGIMGILKAGGAYLPIDTEYPQDRIEYMLKNSNSYILLTQRQLMDSIKFDGIVVDLEDNGLYEESKGNLEKINSSSDLAYIIYTSGSTGNPKGVMVEHRSVIRLIKNTNYITFNNGDCILQTGSLSFDASIFEIWGAILNGLELHLVNKNVILSIENMEKYIIKNHITILWLTASLFKFMAQERPKMFENLKYLLVGGDVLSTKHINRVMKECRDIKIINGYGPTENTTFSTCFLVNKEYDTNIPIGKPINNSRAYIFDNYNKLQPIGVCGELCVAGDGLARGYVNNVELTDERFIPNPLIPGEKMYKTGDIARWLSDGNIEFLGRIDHQVKIRGFRIELSEIENQLLKQKGVEDAVVIDREDKKGSKYLCAYIECDRKIRVAGLSEGLSKELPEYMIPACFIHIEKIPLTENGKIDRNALPTPDGDINTELEYVEPRNEIEAKIAKVWSEVLGVEKIGVDDDFFTLGGHSLKAMQVVSMIHRELNVEVTVGEVFSNPTIGQIGEYIRKSKESKYASIKPIEERDVYKVSSAQKRLFALNQFGREEINYNIPAVMLVKGKLEKVRVEETFRKLIERHEVFRTSFELKNEGVVQRIHKEVKFNIEYDQVNKIGKEAIEEMIKRFINPFDLSKAPLLRAKLVREQEDKHILMVDMHHIISDGTTIGIIIDEFAKLYKGELLEELTIQYKEYSAWENELLDSEVMKKQNEYWMNIFNDDVPVLDISTDYQRPMLQSFEGESIAFKLDKELSKKIRKIGNTNGATLYMTLLSTYNILLSRYSGQEDIIVGSPIAGRHHADLRGMVGMFVNTLAMRNHVKGEKTFEEFLQDVKKNALSAYENQAYQFDKLIEKLDIRRDLSRNVLFDAMFVLQNTDIKEIVINDLKFETYEFENKISKFDLTLSATEIGEEISFNLEYCTALFKRETIERIIEHFETILREVAENPEIKISEIEMLSKKEKKRILVDFNGTSAEYPKDKTVQELFEEQVEKTPEDIAVVFEDKELTYRELNEKSNQLARILRSKGVKSDSIVGIMIERSPEMIIGIMAILKAGGAYLPIDTNYPKNRIEYMLNDSKSLIVLSTKSLLYNIRYGGQCIDLLNKESYKGETSNLEKINSPNDLIYVIYTSGTTGNPKGTVVRHQSFTNLMQWYNSEFEISGEDNILLIASISFDLAQKNIYAPLIVGAKLILANKGVISYEKVNRIINENKITIINCAPSMFNPIVELNKETNYVGLESLKYIFLGGEPINLNKLNDWINSKECSCKIVNTYGPTECTDIATFYRLKKEKTSLVPIGKPINNVKLYILDKYKNLVSVGIQGELYIAGDGLSRGYLNQPELTLEKFIDNPFEPSKKMYKTGDLARWMLDGNIEFLGRVDHQVKIRGFRIEIGEIESQLLKCAGIKEAVVLDKEDKQGNKYLCAYIACERKMTVQELRGFMSNELPDYMIPAYFIQVEKLELTPNGKINRKSLPEPDGEINTGVEYVAWRNKTEEKLAKAWSKVLGVEKIGIDDDFFILGGNSLKAIKLVSTMHRELNVEVPVSEVFSNPTIRRIGEYIGKSEKSIYSSIKVVDEREVYKVSSAQKRLFTLNQFNKEETNYNLPYVMKVDGKLESEKVEGVFRELIERHEVFRTFFELESGEIVQKTLKEIEFNIEYVEVNENEQDIVEDVIESFIRPFDLLKAPLLRVKLVRMEEKKHLLMVDMHHIISDGTSIGIIMKEFTKLYKGEKLEKLSIQYKDYAAWQNELLDSETIKKQEEHWIQLFSDEIPVLNIPIDYQRPTLQSFEGENIDFKIDKDVAKKIRKIGDDNGATVYMTLLSIYNILLSKYSGQEDIIIGSPIIGRPHADLQGIVGMFVNTLAMRNYPKGEKSFKEFLQDVKKNALNAYENQDYQFDDLIKKLGIRKDLSRNALFDTMFVLQNMDIEEIDIKDLKFRAYEFENRTSKFDITLTATEKGEEIDFNLEYCTKLFKRESIERIIEHFKNILRAVVENSEIKIADINMLSEEERTKILVDFNNIKDQHSKDKTIDYPKDKTINCLFEEQVKRTPNNIALICGDKQLTYIELNQKANQLAKVLVNRGVKRDNVVGIMAERSIEMIIGIIATLKSGGAYLPIDHEYPKARKQYLFQDCEVKVLLTQKHLLENDKTSIGEYPIENIVFVDEQNIYNGYCENLDTENKPTDLMYVCYTSGTTGKPKGVMVEHQNFVAYMDAYFELYEIDSYDATIHLVPFSFDLFGEELFLALLKGGKFVIPQEHEFRDINKLNDLIIQNNVSIVSCSPLLLNEFNKLPKMKSVHTFINGGDVLKPEYINNLAKYGKIFNGYGPAEATIGATHYRVLAEDSEKSISIGKPMKNYRIYILDKNRKLLPIGVPGEMYIGGAGVARGYLNKIELTNEKFMVDPFCSQGRMYKTGDLVMWRNDGNIDFIGRIDEQVKIRGFRIELGEIENQLQNHKHINEAVVLANETRQGNKYLCAYVVSDREIEKNELTKFLSKELPNYMIPVKFIKIDSIPLSNNGKIDKKKLSQMVEINEDESDNVQLPRDGIEKKVIEIWSNALEKSNISIYDDFFEIGGDSLMLIRVFSALNSEFPQSVTMQDLFNYRIANELAYLIKEKLGLAKEKNKFESIEF